MASDERASDVPPDVPIKKPNFFIVGAPKCGTTALYTYFREHPQIFMPPLKEPQFFAVDLLGDRRRIRSLPEYLACFAGARDKPRIGEASTAYLGSKRAAEEIKAFAPDARIIVMLRNPVDKMYSRFNDARFTNQEPQRSFEAALSAEQRCGPSFGLGYRESARYASQVRRYLEVFDRARIHFIIFDDFRERTAATHEEALRFLGVRADDRSDFPMVNERRYVRGMPLQQFVRHPPEVLRRLGRMSISPVMRRRLREWVANLNEVAVPPPPLPADLRRRLQREFQDDVEKLGRLIGRDLSGWCEGEGTLLHTRTNH
jgi:Sulfotransferase domain